MDRIVSFLSNAWLRRCLLAATLVGAYPALVSASELPEVQKLIERRDFRQALVKVNQHLATQPDSIDGRFLKGVVLAESNETAQAIAIFTQLTKDAPQMLEAYNNLGVLYARQQDYDKARATLEAALKVDPAFSAVAGNLRDTYGRLAKQAYDKALGQESAVPGGGKKLVLLSQLRAPSIAPDKALEAAPGKLLPTSLPSATLPPAPQPVIAAAPAAASAPAPAPPTKVAQLARASVASAAPAAPMTERKIQSDPERKAPAAAALSPREKEVQRAVDAWADAWMRKDMKAYLASYASNFKLPGKLSRKEWERERHARIVGKKDRIQLTLDKVDIEIKGSVATAKFLQRYKAGSFSESSQKTLTLTRQGGKWRIKSEN